MSALSKLFPLLVLVVLIGFFAFVGYAIYTIANDVKDKTAKKMEKRHLNFTKDGLVVGIKERREEAYVDRTQRWVLLLGFLFCWGLVDATAGMGSVVLQGFRIELWILTLSDCWQILFFPSASSSRHGILALGPPINPDSGTKKLLKHTRRSTTNPGGSQRRPEHPRDYNLELRNYPFFYSLHSLFAHKLEMNPLLRLKESDSGTGIQRILAP